MRKTINDSRTTGRRDSRSRSAVSNGRRLFVSADARSSWSRRYRDLVEMFACDAGGIECLSELKMGLIRRAAALAIECERMEGMLAEGGKVDIDLLAHTSSHLRRIAESIGLDRVARDVTPSLTQIIAAHAEAPASKPAPRKAVNGAAGASKPLAGGGVAFLT